MFRTPTARFALLLIIIGCLAPCVHAERRGLRKPSERYFTVGHAKLALAPRLMIGKVTGKASELLGDRLQDKIAFGFGGTVEFTVTPFWVVGSGFDAIWMNLPYDDIRPIRMFCYSASVMYKCSPMSRNSVYLRPELGLISGVLPEYFNSTEGDTDLKLGTHTYLKLGLGVFSHTTPNMNIRTELFYRVVFTSDHQLEQLRYTIDDNAEQIGIDIAFGIRIL